MKTGTKILISFGAALIAAVFSLISHIVLLPVLALGAFMAVEWGFIYLVPMLAAIAVPRLLAPIEVGGIVSLAELILIPLCLAFFEKKRLPHRYTLIALAVVICLGEYLMLTLGSMLAGKAPYEGAVEAWNSSIAAFEASFGSGGAEFASSLREFSDVIPDILMWACLLCAELFSFALLMFYRLWSKAFRVEPRPMADITEWRLPKSMLLGSGLMCAFIVLVYLLKLNGANAIAYSLGLIVASLFAVQGASLLLFIFKASGASRAMTIALSVFSVLFFPWSMGILAVFGLVEQIKNRRGKIKKFLNERAEARKLDRLADEYEKYGYIRGEHEQDEGSGDKDSNNDDPVKED